MSSKYVVTILDNDFQPLVASPRLKGEKELMARLHFELVELLGCGEEMICSNDEALYDNLTCPVILDLYKLESEVQTVAKDMFGYNLVVLELQRNR